MNRPLTLTLCLAASTLAACGDDNPDSNEAEVEITASERSNLATTISRTAIHEDGGEIGAVVHSAVLLNGVGMPAFGLELGQEGRFIGRFGAFDYTFDVDCYDVDGLLTLCGNLAQSADISATWSASIERPRRESEATYSGRWSVRRMDDGRFEINGRGDLDFDSDFASASGKNQKTTDLRWAAIYTDLIVDPDMRDYPVDGHVDYAIELVRTHDTPGRERTDVTDIDARLIFEAEDADLYIDDDHYRVDVRANGDVMLFEEE